MSGPAGADIDELLTLAARNSERYGRMAPGALDEPLRRAARYRIEAVRSLLGEPLADFCGGPHGWLAAGTAVTYRGSLTAEHGRWMLEGFCECEPCEDDSWRPGGTPRYQLLRMDDGRRLSHVRPASFAPVPR